MVNWIWFLPKQNRALWLACCLLHGLVLYSTIIIQHNNGGLYDGPPQLILCHTLTSRMRAQQGSFISVSDVHKYGGKFFQNTHFKEAIFMQFPPAANKLLMTFSNSARSGNHTPIRDQARGYV